MRVPGPNILVDGHPLLVREGRDLDHHVSACSEGARACWGGVCRASLQSGSIFAGGGGEGAAKGLHPCFLVPKGSQPTACTLALWWLKFGPTGPKGGGGGALRTPKLSHGTMCFVGAGDFVLGIRQGEFFFFDPMCLYSKYSRYSK